jgi:hypothetical protein
MKRAVWLLVLAGSLLLAPSIYAAEGPKPAIKVTPTSLDFGKVPLDSSKELSFTIQNTGQAELQGNASSLCGEFSLSGGGSFKLQPKMSKTLRVRFQPKLSGSYTCAIVIFSNDPKNWLLLVQLKGTGVKPTIEVSPLELDFGKVKVVDSAPKGLSALSEGPGPLAGQAVETGYKDLTFTIKNTGEATLTGEVYGPRAPFSLISGEGPFSLEKGKSLTVKVRFQPREARDFSGKIKISSNDKAQPTVTVKLLGTGIAPQIRVSPTSLSFSEVKVGNVKELSFTIQNTGTDKLTANVGSPAAPFSLTGGGSLNLEPGASKTLKVSFKPTAAGKFTAAITITSNDPKNPAIALKVTGTATVADGKAASHLVAISISASEGHLELINIPSSARVQVELFALDGRMIASAEGDREALSLVPLLSSRPLANGIYLYLLTVRAPDGAILERVLGKLVFLR